MAYIGTSPVVGDFRKIDDISSSFNSSATSFNLAVNGQDVVPGLAQSLIISVDGVIQEPGVAYTVNNSTINFTGAPATGATFFGILLGSVGGVGTPANNSVVAASIANYVITSAKMANTGVVANTYGNATIIPVITVDGAGRITSASNTTLTLSATGVTAGTYGNATIVPVITVDAGGRITAASNTTISLGTMASQNANNVSITGGNITGITTLGANTTVAGNADFDFNGTIVQNIVTVGASSIDCSTGNYFTKTISGTTTFTFDTVPQSRRYGFILQLTNGGSQTVNWPATVVWPAGTAPTLTASGVDLLIFTTSNGGTTWRGSSIVNYAS